MIIDTNVYSLRPVLYNDPLVLKLTVKHKHWNHFYKALVLEESMSDGPASRPWCGQVAEKLTGESLNF